MHLPLHDAADPSVPRPAGVVLNALMASVGVTGLTVAADRPGLLAMIDQHAAAIRDSVQAGDRPITRTLLAGYAEGVCAAAAEHGWSAPDEPIDWAEADWVLLRLLAVCALAERGTAY